MSSTPFLDPVTGRLEYYADSDLDQATLDHIQTRGLRPATPEDVAKRDRDIAAGTTGQQALAQTERVVRGVTLGQVPGFGTEEEIRTRADVSRHESPFISALADVAPDVALAAGVLATGGAALPALGLRAGARAGVMLGAEALTGGAVAASQQAFEEGRTFLHEDLGADVENLAIWTGLGGALAATPAAVRALRGARAAKGAAAAAETVEAVADAAEAKALRRGAGAEQMGIAAAPPETAMPGEVAAPDVAIAPTGSPLAPQRTVDVLNPFVDAGPDQVILPSRPTVSVGAGAPAASLPAPGPFSPAAESIVPMRTIDVGAARGGRRKLPPLPEPPPAVAPEVPALSADPGAPTSAPSAAPSAIGQVVNLPDRAPVDLSGVDISMAAGLGLPPIRLKTRAARKAAAEPVREVIEETADNGLERAVRNATGSEADDVVARAAGGELEREAPSFARDRRLHDYRNEILDTATKTVKSDLDELGKVHRSLTDVATAKPADIARNVGDNLAGQQSQVRQLARSAGEFAGQLRAEASKFAMDVAAAEGRKVGKLRPKFATPTHQRLVVSLMEHGKELEQLAAKGAGPKMFEALDNFKRTVDDYKLSLEAGAKNATDRLPYERLIPRVEEFAHTLRRSAEDQATWGRVGEMQAAYNRVWHDKFIPASRVFNEATQKVTGRDYEGKLISEAWESKLKPLIEGADPGDRRHVVQMLDAMKEGAEARLTYGAATREQVDGVIERIDRIKRTLSLGDEVTAANRRMQALGEAAGTLPFLGGAARSALTGDLGSKLRTLAGASDSIVERSVDDWIRTSKLRGRGRLPRGTTPPKRTRMLPPAAAAVAALATRRGVTHTMAAFMGEENETPQAAFNKWRNDMMDEEAFYGRLEKQFGDIAADSPAAVMAISAHAAKTRQFLLERMPANLAVSMLNPQGYPPSRDAIEDWAIYVNAATDPNSIMRSLSRGDITVQQVEVLRELYPRRYEAIQAALLEKIAGANDLDDQFLMRQNRLWELDGAGSVIFSPAYALRSGLKQSPNKGKAPAPKSTGGPAERMSPASVAERGPTYGSL